jgi:hypothetical protein
MASAIATETAAMTTTSAMTSYKTMTMESEEVVVPVAEVESAPVCNPLPAATKRKDEKSTVQYKEM